MSVKTKHSANPVDTRINQRKKLINHADVGVEMKSTTATNTTFIYNKNRTRDTTTTTPTTLGYDDKMDSKTAE